jgi:multidrug efflux pump subunit AcrA (membrane-fusion protein)
MTEQQKRLAEEKAEASIQFFQVSLKGFKECMAKWGGDCKVETGAVAGFAMKGHPAVELKALLSSEDVKNRIRDAVISIQQERADAARKAGAIEAEGLSSQAERALITAQVEMANNLITSGVITKFEDLFNFVAHGPTATVSSLSKRSLGADIEIGFTRSELKQFSDDLETAVRFDAFTAAADVLTKLAAAARKDAPDHETYTVNARIATFAEAYTRAYFREGQFASLTLDQASLESFLTARVKAMLPTLSDETVKGIVAKLIAEMPKPTDGKFPLFGKIGDASFKTRGGANFKFPAITATLKLGAPEPVVISKVDFVAVGADLLRVFLEAVGDGIAGVPGVSDATGCKTTRVALQVFSPSDDVKRMSADDFGKVNEFANKAEAFTSAAVGRVIRGLSFFSLNNESIATLIETSAGVIVKKASEKVIWCGLCAYKQAKGTRVEDPVSAFGTSPSMKATIAVSGALKP